MSFLLFHEGNDGNGAWSSEPAGVGSHSATFPAVNPERASTSMCRPVGLVKAAYEAFEDPRAPYEATRKE
jgi:hypothetical protein